MTIELTLLSRVAYRDQEITGPRMRGLLALLAGDLRTGCSTGRLVEGLWPDEQPENPPKALQVLVSRARAQLGSDVIASRARPGHLPNRRGLLVPPLEQRAEQPPDLLVEWRAA